MVKSTEVFTLHSIQVEIESNGEVDWGQVKVIGRSTRISSRSMKKLLKFSHYHEHYYIHSKLAYIILIFFFRRRLRLIPFDSFFNRTGFIIGYLPGTSVWVS